MELEPVVPLQIAVTKTLVSSAGAASTANSEYDKLTNPNTPIPTPPVHAARLSALLKSLANAEGAVSESIKARRSLLDGLEKILETNRAALTNEEHQLLELASRKSTIESRKREVEDGIMRGLSAESSPAVHGNPVFETNTNGKHTPQGTAPAEPERPNVEELTPPPIESFTPEGSPHPAQTLLTATTSGSLQQQPEYTEPTPLAPPPGIPALTAGSDLLSSLSMPPVRLYAGSPGGGSGGTLKKRKLAAEFPGFSSGDAMADLDEDVAELLRAESGGL